MLAKGREKELFLCLHIHIKTVFIKAKNKVCLTPTFESIYFSIDR